MDKAYLSFVQSVPHSCAVCSKGIANGEIFCILKPSEDRMGPLNTQEEKQVKIKLNIEGDRREAVRQELNAHDIEVDESSDLILSEARSFAAYLAVKNEKGERLRISCADIVMIESFGHDVEVHTTDGTYAAVHRLYQLDEMLEKTSFFRVSNSVIISRRFVKKIRPSLSMKFILTMEDGTLVDVTRSYYASFKTFFGI